MAAEKGDLCVVDRLLQDDRVMPSARNNDAIKLAFHHKHFNVVSRLLKDPRLDTTGLDSLIKEFQLQSVIYDQSRIDTLEKTITRLQKEISNLNHDRFSLKKTQLELGRELLTLHGLVVNMQNEMQHLNQLNYRLTTENVHMKEELMHLTRSYMEIKKGLS